MTMSTMAAISKAIREALPGKLTELSDDDLCSAEQIVRAYAADLRRELVSRAKMNAGKCPSCNSLLEETTTS